MPSRAALVTAGGITWLVGVMVLEALYDVSDDRFPIAFPVLALLAGVLAGWGLWSTSALLDKRLARFGGRVVAVSSGVLGFGFGLELLPFDAGIGFLFAYTFGLFFLPLGYLVLGLGVLGSGTFPGWGKWVPSVVAAAGVANYGFHALAPEVWDPPDVFWFSCIGAGWLLLGLTSFRISADVTTELSEHAPRVRHVQP